MRAFGTLDIIVSRQTWIVLLVALIAFGASVGGSFHLDDYSLFAQNLWRPLQPRPLTYLTFWINDQLGGRNPIGYHAVNLALHLMAVVLLMRALGRLIPQRAAFVAAAVFALHPFVAEPINYVFERSTILATVFCLMSLLAWTRQRYWLATLAFAAALLAKEECAAFPLLLVLLNFAGARERRQWPPVAAMLGLSIAAGLRVLIAGTRVSGSGIGSQAGITAPDYLLTQGLVICRYLRMLILPWGFTIDPDMQVSKGPLSWLAWAAVILIAGVAARRMRQCPEALWFLGGLLLLLPSSSIFPAADLAADRRMYLPLIAFSASIGIAASTPSRSVLVMGVAVLAVLSFERTMVWHSEESLWSDAAAKAPGKVRPNIQLARALGGARGLAILEQAEKLAPHDPAIASEEGRIELEMGRAQQALLAFGQALALEPGSAPAHNNRGVALSMLGQWDAARADFERALAIDPCQFDARLNLARSGTRSAVPAHCSFTDEQRAMLLGNNIKGQ